MIMSLKETWIPQDATMDASPDIPNMLADAVIKLEETSVTKSDFDDEIQKAIYDSWGSAV